MITLCKICNSANSASFETNKCARSDDGSVCYICKEAASKTDEMIARAAVLLAEEKARSFSISTVIPKDWLTREERVWDEKIHKGESIKNSLNRAIVSALRKASGGAEYSSEGECRLIFDYCGGHKNSSDAVTIQRNELFIFGRYKKFSAGLSQSRWRCSKCDGKGCGECNGKGKFYESVEERVGEPLKKAAQADDYVMHASGREDVDATNSAGRPFVLEIKNPKNRKFDLEAATSEIKSGEEVAVEDLRIVGRSFVEMVTESHFDKTYEADVEFEKELSDEDIAKIRTLEGKTILQQTPKRVAHRRANLVRHRKVKHIEVAIRTLPNETGNHENGDPFSSLSGSFRTGNRKQATLIIKAEAGTYIKELISGDDGRTNPSVSALLNTKAKCKKLEVVGIDDGFLDFCLKMRE